MDDELGGPHFAVGHGESGFQNGDPRICFQASAAVARDLSLASSPWSSSNLKCSTGLIGQCQVGGRVDDAGRSPFSSEWQRGAISGGTQMPSRRYSIARTPITTVLYGDVTIIAVNLYGNRLEKSMTPSPA